MGKPPVDSRGKGVQMLEETQVDSPSGGDFVEFTVAGARAHGEFRCSKCGYGITVYATLPECPMCAGASWEAAEWSPFTRARVNG